MKCYQLRAWGLAKTKLGICVEGLCENTSVMWHSSEIVRRVSSRVLESSSGSQYELVGPMSKTNCSTKCFSISTLNKFQNGFPVNWRKLLQRKTGCKSKNIKKKPKPTKGMESVMVDKTHKKLSSQLSPFKMAVNTSTMPQVLRTRDDTHDGYETDCLTAFDSDNSAEKLIKFPSTKQILKSRDFFQCGQNVRKRLNFADIDDTQPEVSDLFVKTAVKRSPTPDDSHRISCDVLVQSLSDRRTVTTSRCCCPPNKHLNVGRDCSTNDGIRMENVGSKAFSVERVFTRKRSRRKVGNVEIVENPSSARLLNSMLRANKGVLEKNKKSSRPQKISKPNKANGQVKSKRPFPSKMEESSPKRLRLESPGDAFDASDECFKQDHVVRQPKVINLPIQAPMSRSPSDLSFDALTQSFGPNTMVFTCYGSTNKTLENVILNVSQDCLLSDSVHVEHRKSKPKLSEMGVQTSSSIAVSARPQKNKQQAKQSNKKVKIKRNISRRSSKMKSDPREVNLQKRRKIKKKPTKVDKENDLPEFEALKGKNTLKKSRAFKKLMTDCLKTQGNGHDYLANISQQQWDEDKEAAKVLALFEGNNETSEIHFNLTSSMFSKSPVAGVSKTLLDSTSSVMNDTATAMLMPSLQVSRDADLEMFRMNKIMKGKKTTEPETQQAQKGYVAKKCLELPEEAFQMKEVTEEESGRDDFFNESEI